MIDLEALLINGLLNVYAKRFAEAYRRGDTETANEIRDYIFGNYKQHGLDELAKRAMQMIVSN